MTRARKTTSGMLAAAMLAVLTACGGGDAGSGTIAAEPAATVTSENGVYRVSVHSAPDAVPSRGVNTLQMVVTRVADGPAVSDLALDVVPWMPAMGHGASVKPSVHAEGEPGVYTITNVTLFMPGLWEIRTTIEGAAARDHVTPSFEIH